MGAPDPILADWIGLLLRTFLAECLGYGTPRGDRGGFVPKLRHGESGLQRFIFVRQRATGSYRVGLRDGAIPDEYGTG